MGISTTKRKFLINQTIFTAIVGGLGALILKYWLPEDYFNGFIFVLVYYYLFGLFNIHMFEICRRNAPQKLVLVYLALKVMKIIVSVAVMLIYCMIVRDNIHGFLLVFIAYYLLYLIFETWFFFLFEIGKKYKTKTKNETIA